MVLPRPTSSAKSTRPRYCLSTLRTVSIWYQCAATSRSVGRQSNSSKPSARPRRASSPRRWNQVGSGVMWEICARSSLAISKVSPRGTSSRGRSGTTGDAGIRTAAAGLALAWAEGASERSAPLPAAAAGFPAEDLLDLPAALEDPEAGRRRVGGRSDCRSLFSHRRSRYPAPRLRTSVSAASGGSFSSSARARCM